MTKRKGRQFRELLIERLANPLVAVHYLNEAIRESDESFLVALKTVAQAQSISKIAKSAGVQRESLYRALSEQGNPTFETLSAVLTALGMKLSICEVRPSVAPSSTPAALPKTPMTNQPQVVSSIQTSKQEPTGDGAFQYVPPPFIAAGLNSQLAVRARGGIL